MADMGRVWAIVLAAGDGKRISSLTTAADGSNTPKQYYLFDNQRSSLRWTIDRAARFTSTHRIVAVVAKHHRKWWDAQLSDLSSENLVVQPRNKGTAAGILLPLLRVLRADPVATVVILPSDHYVADEELLHASIRDAIDAIRSRDSGIVLLGMEPTDADTEYGWILPLVDRAGVESVEAFVEKPARPEARGLMQKGAVLNSLIVVASASSLLALYAHAIPELLEEFLWWQGRVRDETSEVDSLYADLVAHDFSRDLLQRTPERLSVVRVPDCGWTDLGTPDRLRAFYEHRTACLRATA